MNTRDLVILKLRQMDAEISFLEYIWSKLNSSERDYYINNYQGSLPDKYKK